jgi:DNA-binding MarR family transcriptional regulator
MLSLPINEDEDGAHTVVDRLVQVSFMLTALLTRTAAQHDLSLTQLRVLAILRDHAPKMAELADHLGLEKSTVSGLIDRAVRRGLVRRESEPDDGRAVRISLTADGRRLEATLLEQINSLVEPMMRNLSPSQQERLGVLLAGVLR